MKYKTLLIDSPYLAHRSYSAHYHLTSSSGHTATMMHGFIRSLNAVRKKFSPDKILLAWESDGKSRRKDILPNYKEQRQVRTDYLGQLKDLQTLLYCLGVKQFCAEFDEADDAIATYVAQHQKEQILIFTVDKDIMQLIDKDTHVYDGKQIYEFIDVQTKFGVTPIQLPDLLAIWGDVCDNIEGIKGYGLKKSAKLIEKYHTVENIPIDVLPELHRVLLNKSVTLLNRKCDLIPITFSSAFEPSFRINEILTKYGLKSITEKIEEYKLCGSEIKV